jgi:hypothetical protein
MFAQKIEEKISNRFFDWAATNARPEEILKVRC